MDMDRMNAGQIPTITNANPCINPRVMKMDATNACIARKMPAYPM